MKTEPDVFSIDDLARKKTSLWDGVRNFQARNFMREQMEVGDRVLFYHSSCEPPGVAGLAKVLGKAEPDPTQFDKSSKYFDPRASKEKPWWYCVRVGFEEKFPRLVTLAEIRATKALKEMPLLRRGQRLSIQPVTEKEFECIVKMAKKSR